jgi:hypothetical protein
MIVHGVKHRGLSESLELYNEAMDLSIKMQNLSNQILDDNGPLIERAQAYHNLEQLKSSSDYNDLFANTSAKHVLDQCCQLHVDYMKSLTLHTTGVNQLDQILSSPMHFAPVLTGGATLYDVLMVYEGKEKNNFTMFTNFQSSGQISDFAGIPAKDIQDATIEHENEDYCPDEGGQRYSSGLDIDHHTESGLTWRVHENETQRTCHHPKSNFDVSASGTLDAWKGRIKAEHLKISVDLQNGLHVSVPNSNPALDAVRNFFQ